MVRALALLALFAAPAFAAEPCAPCAAWNTPQLPFKVYGNTYYVGPHGLSAILITSDAGHILIDGALADSAETIADNINALGFHPEDVKIILNSHAHYDHAGGIAELQRLGGARVMASLPSIVALLTGVPSPDDPQAGLAERFPRLTQAAPLVRDGQQVVLAPLKLTAHFTPGHTPGSTSWTWESCEGPVCRHMVYADSLTPMSAPGFKFSADPTLVATFRKSIAAVGALPCDILLTPHPDASGLWDRQSGKNFADKDACRRYADTAAKGLDRRLATEAK
ncbi:MAG: subclass B3 metallo-beta-lactamase [Rhodospirillaceae bacterium]|nr:subclass B3 metallo-beta-lactamase [Rhodospirillaceae bacterium]